MIAILSALAPLFLITALGYAFAALKFAGGELWMRSITSRSMCFFPLFS